MESKTELQITTQVIIQKHKEFGNLKRKNISSFSKTLDLNYIKHWYDYEKENKGTLYNCQREGITHLLFNSKRGS